MGQNWVVTGGQFSVVISNNQRFERHVAEEYPVSKHAVVGKPTAAIWQCGISRRCFAVIIHHRQRIPVSHVWMLQISGLSVFIWIVWHFIWTVVLSM